MPQIVAEPEARPNPEMAVLSAMAHGAARDVERAEQIATVALSSVVGLDEERACVYCDFIINASSEAARNALKTMDARTYEYQSDFARRYVAQGRAQGIEQGIEQGMTRGEAAGRMALINRLLTLRFGSLNAEVERIRGLSVAELDVVGERLLSATTLKEALGEE